MRELINILTESRGLGARRAGEEFVSTTNPDEKIYVKTVSFYPQDRAAYDSYEEMAAELQKIVHAIPNAYVDLIGKFGAKDLAFGVAIFSRPAGKGQDLAFVKPYRSVKPDPTQNQWDNQTGIPGFRYNSKAAAKTQAGMTPQDVLVTKMNDLTASEIVGQIQTKFGPESSLTKFAQAVASGQKFPIKVPADPQLSFTAFRDYFCELLHPIALQKGNYSGNAGEAADKFLGAGGFANTKINFGADKTEGLSDSKMVAPGGQQIKVSSKGAGGAEASSKNLLDAVNELKDPKLVTKHSQVIDLIKDIVQGGQAGAPLVLGVRYGFISAEDSADIQNFKKLPPTTLSAVDQMGISDKLKTLIKERATANPDSVNLYFHSIAAVAHKVAKHINESTNFSQAASEILNNGALIQVYTQATESPEAWTVTAFNTVWPSQTVTGVKFSASKTYYSTGIKGNFTFKILRNGATDVDDDRSTEPVLQKSTVAAPSVVTGIGPEIKHPDSRPKRAVDVGRARR